MQPGNAATGYCIWGVDNIVYGPVDLPTLVNWVQEERVTANTWINLQDRDKWERAAQIAELQMFFQPPSSGGARQTTLNATDGTTLALKPGALRRVRILAGLSDRQLDRFLGFMDVERFRQWAEVVKQGSPGDAMYLILEGEVRVRMMIGGKERILVTLAPGEFFGEIALMDSGTRSADVVANQDSVLLRITAGAVHKLIAEAPEVAAPFLMAISKTLVARIRADNKRYRESITFPSTMR